MFERIKPTTQIRTVALPGDIADTLQYVYLCNKIEKRGIIIKGNHGGLCHQSGSYGGCDYAACGSTGTCNLTDNRHEIWKCEGRI